MMPLLALLLALGTGSAAAGEIYALGTSSTNCMGVTRARSYTVHLESLLRKEGFDVSVTNGGVDGDKPIWMANRLFGPSGISANTLLVLFEPGSNDKNVHSNMAASENILAELQKRRMPVIYASHGAIQSNEKARATAEKYGARYYGHWSKDVPLVGYRVADGHLNGDGCELVARNMLPLVRSTLLEIGVKPGATPPSPSEVR